MMLTLVSRGNLWITKLVGKNCFKGFLTSSWLTYTTLVNNRLFVHWCTAIKTIHDFICLLMENSKLFVWFL